MESQRRRVVKRDLTQVHQKNGNTHLLKQSTKKDKLTILQTWFCAEYVTVDKVPEQYQEPFILTGYRQPHSSFLYCIVSAFRLNNETLNIWTHFIPFVAFIVYFWKTSPSQQLWTMTATEPLYYPLIAEEISILAYHLCSTIAHTFNCMSPRVRHICFYLDYAAISLYGIGVGCSTVHYSWPVNSKLFLFQYPSYYIRFCSVLCIVVMYVMCASRHKWAKVKYVVRTLAYMSMFVYTNSPTFYRFWRYLLNDEDDHLSLSYTFVGWSAYVVAAVLNPSRLPERYSPRTFDIVGHNHQLLHVLVTLASLLHLWAVQLDIVERRTQMEDLSLRELNSSLEWTFGTLIVTLAIALWFSVKLTPSGHLKTDQSQ